MLRQAIRRVLADGVVTEHERAEVQALRRSLGIAPEAASRIFAEEKSQLSKSMRLAGAVSKVAAPTPSGEIVRAWLDSNGTDDEGLTVHAHVRAAGMQGTDLMVAACLATEVEEPDEMDGYVGLALGGESLKVDSDAAEWTDVAIRLERHSLQNHPDLRRICIVLKERLVNAYLARSQWLTLPTCNTVSKFADPQGLGANLQYLGGSSLRLDDSLVMGLDDSLVLDVGERRLGFSQASVKVGRADDADVVIRDKLVSRRHCEFAQHGDDWIVRDLGSQNGTFVNGYQADKEGVFVDKGSRVTLGVDKNAPELVVDLPLVSAPPVAPDELRPRAKFQKVEIDHGIVQAGVQGMVIRTHFTVAGMKGLAGQVGAFFVHQNGQFLKDVNQAFRSSDGNVSVGCDISPPYFDTNWNELRLFMPYAELHLGAAKADCAVRLQAFLKDRLGKWWCIATAADVPFQWSGQAQVPPPAAPQTQLPAAPSLDDDLGDLDASLFEHVGGLVPGQQLAALKPSPVPRQARGWRRAFLLSISLFLCILLHFRWLGWKIELVPLVAWRGAFHPQWALPHSVGGWCKELVAAVSFLLATFMTIGVISEDNEDSSLGCVFAVFWAFAYGLAIALTSWAR
jgi:hypothetical protein